MRTGLDVLTGLDNACWRFLALSVRLGASLAARLLVAAVGEARPVLLATCLGLGLA